MFSEEGYRALRSSAGVIRRGDRGILSVTGADRLTWLQGLLTNDVAALSLGDVCDAAYLTPQGRMITDVRVVQLADSTLLDIPASLADSLRARLDALLFSEDAQIADRTATMKIVDVHGPLAPSIVDAARASIEPTVTAVVSDAPYVVPGYSILVPGAGTDEVVRRLVEAGGVETTLETLDVLRVEAGMPAFLVDMDEHTIPLEAGLEKRAISFTKGCYVGQEVIVRVTQRGHGRVARRLVGLLLAKGPLPKAGAAISSGERPVGRVTSAVWSPTLQSGIALGYVLRDYVEPGTPLEVSSADSPIVATVTTIPFVSA